MIFIWQTIAITIDNSLIFPSAYDILNKIFSIISESKFLLAIVLTIFRSLISIIIALVIGLILGIISFKNKYIYNSLYPLMSIIRSIPTMAFIVVALIWFSKDSSTILIAVLIGLPLFYDVVISSMKNIENGLINMSRVYEIPKKIILKEIYIKSIFLSLIDTLSSTVSLIFKVIIASELYSQPKFGIGAAIQFEKMQLNTDSILAWIIIVAIVSICFDKVIDCAKKNVNRFREV